MKRFVFVLLLLAPSIYPISILAASPEVQTSSAADHATIRRRNLVLIRSAAVVKQFPHKRRATLSYPVISGLEPAILRRVRSLLDFMNIFDYSVKEYREDTWLDEFNYEVSHNGNYLLDITFNQSGSGAYPDDQSKHFLINLRNGSVVKAADAFEVKSLAKLSVLVNRKLQAELKQILQELRQSKSDPEDVRVATEAQEPLEFKVENLDDFSVGAKGISFLYDAGYPHVIQAFEPEGKYFFSYAELKPFIKPDGPLGQFIR